MGGLDDQIRPRINEGRDTISEVLERYSEKKLNILLANDDHIQLNITQQALSSISCIGTIDTAKNGQQAFDLVRKNEIQG